MRYWTILPVLLLAASAHAQDAETILERVDEKARGASSKSEMVVETIRPGWTREMRIKSWTLGDDYAVILVTAPKRDAGTAFLKRDKEVWNWVPSIERTVKLPPSMMMQNWMGTDFTNDDLVQESSMIDDFESEIIRTEIIDGREAWKIRLIPNEDANVVWAEIRTWIDKEEYVQLRSEFYDEDGWLASTLTFSDLRDFDGRILPGTMEMIPSDKEGHRTVIRTISTEFDVDLETRFFQTSTLRTIR